MIWQHSPKAANWRAILTDTLHALDGRVPLLVPLALVAHGVGLVAVLVLVGGAVVLQLHVGRAGEVVVGLAGGLRGLAPTARGEGGV